MAREVKQQYKEIVARYITSQSEEDLYAGQQFSRQFIEKKIAPEEVISIHKSTLQEVFTHLPDEIWHSFDFLIEMMVHYGLALREHQSLVRKQEGIDMEMTIAAKVQDTLLKTKVPDFNGLDIGFLSLAAKRMNGDYIYFVSDDKNYASVAVADVIGKGIPAALCMSMIKFGMDSMQNENANPRVVLDIVNRIVEESVDDSMFISMFYGKYETKEAKFTYASAGHEPALFYQAKEETFTELDAKGLLLGVHPDAVYEERSIILGKGDFITIMTDGVTETRTEQGFIEKDLIRKLLEGMKDKPAQKIVDAIYHHLAELQNFQLRDDFTIVVIKKEL